MQFRRLKRRDYKLSVCRPWIKIDQNNEDYTMIFNSTKSLTKPCNLYFIFFIISKFVVVQTEINRAARLNYRQKKCNNFGGFVSFHDQIS